jgi:hypothetical protein
MNQNLYFFFLGIFVLGFFIFQSSPSELLNNLTNTKTITQSVTTPLPKLKVTGQVIDGNQETTKIGFPTANLKIDANLQLPTEFKTGLYLARCALSSQAISIYQNNQPNWSNYREPEKKYLVYFHLSPSRDICYCYFPDLPTQVNLVNQRMTLEEITQLDSHLVDFIQSYHNHLDKTKTNNYVKTYYR